MDCPVCHKKSISPFATRCPECGTDVVAYPILEDLEEQAVDTLKEKVALEGNLSALEQLRKEDLRGYRSRMSRMYWFLFLLPLMFFWCGKKNVLVSDQAEMDRISAERDSLARKLSIQQSENEGLREKVTTLQTALNQDTVTHLIRKGESLYLLSEKYLGDGNRWKIIQSLNPHLKSEDLVYPGDTIRVRLR